MKLPNLVNPSADSPQKIGPDFCKKEVQKWKLSKSAFKKIWKIQMILDTFWQQVSGWIQKMQFFSFEYGWFLAKILAFQDPDNLVGEKWIGLY